MKQIFLPDHLKREILSMKWNVNGQRRKVSQPTLWAALTYTTKTKLADTLRAAALQRGGVIYDSSAKLSRYIPDCYATTDHENGVMTFVFSGLVILTWHKQNATVEIISPDENSSTCSPEIHTIEQLMGLQHIAEQMANELSKKID